MACLDSVMSELYFKRRPFLDLWTLPNARLTSTLATEIEENFYARCPPELRPDLCPSQSSGPSDPAKKEETRSASVTPSTFVEDKEKQEGGMNDATTLPAINNMIPLSSRLFIRHSLFVSRQVEFSYYLPVSSIA